MYQQNWVTFLANFLKSVTFISLLGLLGCQTNDVGSEGNAAENSASNGKNSHTSSTRFAPNDGKIALIIGQDLGSNRDYTNSKCCPVPAGTTTYIGLFKLLDRNHEYGGIGIDPEGKPLDFYADWGGGKSSLYKLMEEYPNSAIAIGLSMTENEHPGAMAKLIAGEYDKNIRHLTKLIKQHPKPVYLRIGYEFDGMWNQGYGNRQAYIDSYRRVADVVRDEGASNVSFVWQSSTSPADDSIEGGHEDIKEWYPGDEYVDWMGLSWFLAPDYVGEKSNFPSTQNALADEILVFARERNKAVMIAEASPLAYDLKRNYRAFHSNIWDGQPHQGKQSKSGEMIWNEWFVPFFSYIYDNSDVIKAVAYINANWDAQSMWAGNYESGYWGDSRVQENPYVLEKWLDEISSDVWIHSSAELDKELNFLPK